MQELKDESPSDKPADPAKMIENNSTSDQEDPISTLTEVVAGLAVEIKSHHLRAAARERVIDNLHAEVERLRVGERNLALRPVTTDLQHLRTDLLRQAKELQDETTRAQVVELLESFALTVEQTLERCGIVPLRPEPGAEFSGRQHRATKIQSARNPDQDGTIAEVKADGYHDTVTDRVTEPARVVVWRWTPDSGPAEADGATVGQEETSEHG